MLTRCPHCRTAFRVTSEQLRARQGQVRCGVCRVAFNAIESLTDEATLPTAIAETVTASVVMPPQVQPQRPQEPQPPLEAEATAEPLTEPAPVLLEETAATVEEVVDGGDRQLPPQGERGDKQLPSPLAGEGLRERGPYFTLTGIVILLALAAAQLLYIFRTELVILAPALRPALTAGCELLGCVLPLPQQPEFVGIESSDLEPLGTDRLRLTATLKNRAPFAQQYPHIELTLTDANDEPLVRKALTPAAFLPAGSAPATGFAAHSEIAIKLTFEAAGVPAVGYRLYLFYP